MSLPEPRTRAGATALAALLAEPLGAVVALDFDGTLAPVVEDPADSRPAAGALEALAALSALVDTVAVITGRPAETAVRLGGFARAPGLERLTVLGHYGLQRWVRGRLESPAPDPAVDVVRRELPIVLADAAAGVTVEDKVHSVVVHTRRSAAPQQALDELTGRVERLAWQAGLEVVPGRFVLEVRPPGTDKGGALLSLTTGRSPSAVLFAGDDVGDLPALAAVAQLRAEGVPSLVVCADSAESPPALRRDADLVVDGPVGLVALLAGLVAALGTP